MPVRGRNPRPQASGQRNAPARVLLVGFQNQGNLGLGYLASTLRERGYAVRTLDIEQDPAAILKAARADEPILIGFSLIFQFYIERYAELLRYLRANGVRCHFTMGGHFPSLSFRQTLECVPDLDSVVRFEGEETLVELANAIRRGEDWRGIHGIAHGTGADLIANPPRHLLDDLDRLPYPERNYDPKSVLGRNIMPILASRGCARTCSFCSIHTFYRAAPGRIVRTRKPASVVQEMRMLHEEHDVSVFLFQDDDFPLFGQVWRRWANEFVDELQRSGLPERTIFKLNCRADAVERELFARLRDAGLYLVYMGLESGSEHGLETLHKQITVEQNLRAVELLKSLGLMWEYGFMLLDPSSTFESVRANLQFLRTILSDGCLPVTFCRMLPYDGTPIKEELVRTGRLLGDVCNPDYDFLDPKLSAFYDDLREHVSLDGWIHGQEAVTLQLGCAWHEVAVLKRLFPTLPGMHGYELDLRRITQGSNQLLLDVVENLTYFHTEGRPKVTDPAALERKRKLILREFLATRNAFVFEHQSILLEALGVEPASAARKSGGGKTTAPRQAAGVSKIQR